MLENSDNFNQNAEGASGRSRVSEILASDLPPGHPVAMFERAYVKQVDGALLPRERDMIDDPQARATLKWAQLIEPMEDRLNGVDFLVVRSGARFAKRDGSPSHDSWMREGLDPEFVGARYREVITSAILRRPVFSRGPTPTRERAYIYVLRGIFPVFAETRYRIRLFVVSAEPYVEVKG